MPLSASSPMSPNKSQTPNCSLWVTGPSAPNWQAIIAESGLQKQVIITGFQPYETMPQYINLATICINTFLITDATRDIFPTKIVQYLACGKAVIATPLPGMLAIIPGEQQGIIYADSPAGVAAEVVSLLKSPERRQQLGQAGLDYVKQAHSYDKIVRQLETVLSQIAGG